MKLPLLISALCLALCSTHSIAADNEGLYVGVKAGMLKTDLSDLGLDTDDANTVALIGAYQFNNGFAAELEFIPSTDVDISVSGFKVGTASVQTVAVYAAYRAKPTSSPAYFKVRAGLLSEEIDVKGIGGSASESDSGLSFGLGAGINLTPNVMLEAEYTLIEQDVDFLSMGLNFKF